MEFNVEVRDKDGNAVDWKRLDKEVCELWDIPETPDQWATAPGKHYDDNWHEFIDYGVLFLGGFNEGRSVFNPTDLIRGFVTFGAMFVHTDCIITYQHEILMILDWTKKGYTINVEWYK
ncbi:MAG: hypothetical protein K2J15_02595 [Muribaculaceae bacterium]|nr:hypothetical protein [Muribaculaceae bacterium]